MGDDEDVDAGGVGRSLLLGGGGGGLIGYREVVNG